MITWKVPFKKGKGEIEDEDVGIFFSGAAYFLFFVSNQSQENIGGERRVGVTVRCCASCTIEVELEVNVRLIVGAGTGFESVPGWQEYMPEDDAVRRMRFVVISCGRRALRRRRYGKTIAWFLRHMSGFSVKAAITTTFEILVYEIRKNSFDMRKNI